MLRVALACVAAVGLLASSVRADTTLATAFCDGSVEFGGAAFGPVGFKWNGFLAMSEIVYGLAFEKMGCLCDGLTEEEFVKHWLVRSPEFLLNMLAGPKGGDFSLDSCTLPEDASFFLNNTAASIAIADSFTSEFYAANGYAAFQVPLKDTDVSIAVVLAGCSKTKNSFVQLKCIGADCDLMLAPCSADSDCSGGLKCVHVSKVEPECELCHVDEHLNAQCNTAESDADKAKCTAGDRNKVAAPAAGCTIDGVALVADRKFGNGFFYYKENADTAECEKLTCNVAEDGTAEWSSGYASSSDCGFDDYDNWESAYPFNAKNTINWHAMTNAATPPFTRPTTENGPTSAGVLGEVRLGADNVYADEARDRAEKRDVESTPIAIGDAWWRVAMDDAFETSMSTTVSEAEAATSCPTSKDMFEKAKSFARRMHFKAVGKTPAPADLAKNYIIGVCAPQNLLGADNNAKVAAGEPFSPFPEFETPEEGTEAIFGVTCTYPHVDWDCDGDGVTGPPTLTAEQQTACDADCTSQCSGFIADDATPWTCTCEYDGATTTRTYIDVECSENGYSTSEGSSSFESSCDGYVDFSCTKPETRSLKKGDAGLPADSLTPVAKRDALHLIGGVSPPREKGFGQTRDDAVIIAHLSCTGTVSLHPNSKWFGVQWALPRFADLYDFFFAEHRAYQNCRSSPSISDEQYGVRFIQASWALYWLTEVADADKVELGPDFNDMRLRPQNPTADARIKLPSTCSYAEWRANNACTLQFSGVGDLFGFDATFRFYYAKCPQQDFGEFYLDCLGAACDLLKAPVPCPSGTCPHSGSKNLVGCKSVTEIMESDSDDNGDSSGDSSTNGGDSASNGGDGASNDYAVNTVEEESSGSSDSFSIALLSAVASPAGPAFVAAQSQAEETDTCGTDKEPHVMIAELLYTLADKPYAADEKFCFPDGEALGERAQTWLQDSLDVDSDKVEFDGFEPWIEPKKLDPVDGGRSTGALQVDNPASTTLVSTLALVAALVAALLF